MNEETITVAHIESSRGMLGEERSHRKEYSRIFGDHKGDEDYVVSGEYIMYIMGLLQYMGYRMKVVYNIGTIRMYHCTD